MALEPRIRAAAPSCYLTSFDRLLDTIGPQDLEQNFTGFIANGLDHADFVIAFAPRPALISAASGDFFDIGGTWDTFREAKRIYGRLRHAGAVDLVEADGPHGFQPALRQRVGRFFEETLMNRRPADIVRSVEEGKVYPDADLQCTESGQVVSSLRGSTVADIWREREKELREKRERHFEETPRAEWLREVRKLSAMAETVAPLSMENVGEPAEMDGVTIEKFLSKSSPPVALRVLRPSNNDVAKANSVRIVVDDDARPRFVSHLLARARSGETIVCVDLPGYGETTPHSRRGRLSDVNAAVLAFHLGRNLAGMRADALRQVIAWAAGITGVEAVHVMGRRRAAVPALLAAVMDSRVQRLELEEALESYASIVEDGLHGDRLGNVVPGALALFDLPLLRKAMEPRSVELMRPVGPHGKPLEGWGF